MEFNRQGSLADFQKKLDEQMMDGVVQARTFLESQLGPLMEELEAKRESEKKEWQKQLSQSTDESIEQYKARLENASNSWLLASATTLGQHSQTVLDTIAKAAEKRLRETCTEVLSGMGDTLKQRLLGISADFRDEDEPGDLPKPKNSVKK
jgi:vacuolar-type H+-ATPase subunit E/Vma4